MILYHGSLERVDKPEIRNANRTLDYGNGFYTTTSEEQAILWVKRKTRQKLEVQDMLMFMRWMKNV